ncbi:hypothetical protein F5B19DRAFT_493979 [Rostrohypoxylon terebratum]|nr:hypothetical protein F5B19DRAFT_493979 [Rostrohypoxylon terebratum]
MERDPRRARSQWRGCHTFNNIICDGDQITNQKRSGGLKMGQTYYYYYELDGSTETYDPSMPTTNACPYLPGQTVNTLDVPSERLSRIRSASMNSLRITDYRTMEPRDKFMTPRPAPPVPSLPDLRVGSSPQPAMSLVHKRSARSLSPAPSWTSAARRFLGRKKICSQDSDAGSETEVESHCGEEIRQSRRYYEEPRSTTPSGRSIRSRDMSPESLRRFLSDDLPQSPAMVEQAPRLFIPDEIIEENEDDDNFATSAVSENVPFTVLSPSPFQRSVSSSSVKPDISVSATVVVPVDVKKDNGSTSKPIGALPRMETIGLDVPRSHFSYSTTSSSMVSPVLAPSPEPRDLNQYSFFDDSDNDSEDNFPTEDESFMIQGIRQSSESTCTIPKHLNSPITGYSLPQPATQNEKHLDVTRIPPAALGSPALVTRIDSGVSLGSPGLLGRPGIDAGLDDLVSDMGWMANFI